MTRKLPKNLFMAFVALTIAHIIWGAASPIIKATLVEIPTYTFVFLRFLLVGIICLPFIYLELKTNPINFKDIPNMIILGLLGQSSLVFLFIGLNYTSSIDAVVLGVIAPLFSIFAGHHFFNERVSKTVKTGVLVAIMGTLVVMLDPILNGNHSGVSIGWRLFGNFMVILYNIAFTAYLLWSKMVMGEKSLKLRAELKLLNIKPMHKTYHPTVITLITFYVALATSIPFALAENLGFFGPVNFHIQVLDKWAILGVLYMAVFSSIIAYLLFQWGLEESTLSDTAIFGYLAPVFTMPFSYLILGEVPTTTVLIGSVLIGIGAYIAEKNKGRLGG